LKNSSSLPGRLSAATLLFSVVLALSAGAQAPPSPHGGARPGFSAFGSLLRVPADFPTIQQAIDAASDHDLVLVGPGTYRETIDFRGKNIVVKSAAGATATIIDGKGFGKDVVSLKNGDGAGAALIGFTVTGGKDNSGFLLSGIVCANGFPIIEDDLITGNDDGIDVDSDSGAVLHNNVIRDNANCGICIGFDDPGIRIEKNLIFGNKIGILINFGSDLFLYRSAVVSNGYYGVKVEGAFPLIDQSIIMGNGRNGVESVNTASPILRNTLLLANSGMGINGQGLLEFCDAWGNGSGDFLDENRGQGTFSADPLFEGHSSQVPADFPTIQAALDASNSFRLGQGSPAIGAGSQGQNLGVLPGQKTFGAPGFNEIHVAAGTYGGTVTLTPWARLIGAGSATTVLSSPSPEHDSLVEAFGSVSGSTLSGFTVQGPGGNPQKEGVNCHGAAISLEDLVVKGNSCGILYILSKGSVLLDNLIVENNGTGIAWSNSQGTIQNAVIRNNAGIGLSMAAPFFLTSLSTVSDCSILGNGGNGIQTFFATTTVERYTVSGNGGRGIDALVDSALTVRESLVTGNGSSGIHIDGNDFNGSGFSWLVANNLTVAGNVGDGLGFTGAGDSRIADSIIQGNQGFGMSADNLSGTIAGSTTDFWMNAAGDTDPGITLGQGNLFTDPMFVSGPQGFYYLSQTAAGQGATSPCVDAGDPAAPLVPGTTRTDELPDQGVLDMGFHHPVN